MARQTAWAGWGVAIAWALAAWAGCATSPNDGGTLTGAGEGPIEIPRVPGVVIDGRAGDWAERGYRVDLMSWPGGQVQPPSDLNSAARLGWDEAGLVVLLDVTDDVACEAEGDNRLYVADCVEIFLIDEPSGRNTAQFIVSPGRDAAHPQPRLSKYDHRTDEALKASQGELSIDYAVVKRADGYVLEARIPWANVGVDPAMGERVAFQFYVTDDDASGPVVKTRWFPKTETHQNSANAHTVVLAERPSAPVVATASAEYELLRRTKVQVVTSATEIGKGARVWIGGEEAGRGTIADAGGRGTLTVEGPMPRTDSAAARLVRVEIGGREAARCELPEAQAARDLVMFDDPGLAPSSCLFATPQFPEIVFREPAYMEDVLGRYEIETTYYDASGLAVTSGDEPGRYGAVARVKTRDGRTFTRYFTLYRQPEGLEWWQVDVDATMDLPPQLGVEPSVAAAYHADVADTIKWAVVGSSENGVGNAILLAGLHEAKADEPYSKYNDTWTRDRQYWVTLKRKLNGNAARFGTPDVTPRVIAGEPARVIHEGTPAEAGMKPDAAEKIDAVLTEWAGDTNEAFIACVVRHGVVVLHKAYGERDGRPMTVDTPSYMASLSKLVSGTQVAVLIDRGLIDFDAPIDTYLPELKGAAFNVMPTMRHLYTHTAGMDTHRGEFDHDLEYVAAEYAPHFQVGERYFYNGMSLELGVKILEQVTGQAYPHFVKANLVDPLGLANTTALNASWNTRSTAMDMAKIGQMLLNGGAYGRYRFMSEQTRDLMLPRKLTRTLGPDTEQQYGIGTSWFEHPGLSERTFGHGAASSATLRIDLENDLVISMTRNDAGDNFHIYHPKFIQAVVDGMVETPAEPATAAVADR